MLLKFVILKNEQKVKKYIYSFLLSAPSCGVGIYTKHAKVGG
jgi:hypothetical protein